MREFYTPQEVGKALKLKKSTLYKKIKSGDIPSVKIAGMIRIPKAELDRLIGAE